MTAGELTFANEARYIDEKGVVETETKDGGASEEENPRDGEQVPPGSEHSCLVLSQQNPVRRFTVRVVRSRAFNTTVLVAVVLSSACLGFSDYQHVHENPDSPRYGQIRTVGWRNNVVEWSDAVFGTFFLVECVLKIVAMGFRGSRGAYTSDPWNCFDFFLVVTWSLEVVLIDMFRLNYVASGLTGIRMIRLLRPLRTISRYPKWRRVASSIAMAIPNLASSLGLLGAFFFLYSLVGVHVFSGKQHGRCRLTPYPVLLNYSFDIHTTNYADFRCLPRRDTFTKRSQRPGLTKSSSPWSTPRECYWPVDTTDSRLCGFTLGIHQCAHRTRRLLDVEWRWCGSDFDPFGNPRFRRTEIFRDPRLFNLHNPYYFPGHSRAWNLAGTRVDPGLWNYDFHYGFTNYDNLLRAMVTNFIIITLGDWSGILGQLRDGAEEHLSGLYIYVLILFGSLAGINIFVAIIEESYEHANDDETSSETPRRVDYRARFRRYAMESTQSRRSNLIDRSVLSCCSRCLSSRVSRDSILARILESGALETVTAFALAFSIVILSLFTRSTDDRPRGKILRGLLVIVHLYFFVEMCIKMAVISIKRYWTTPQHVFDGIITLWLLAELTFAPLAPNPQAHRKSGVRISILSTVRLLRIFRVVDRVTARAAEESPFLKKIGISRFLKIMSMAILLIGATLRDVINILVLLFIFAYIFALLGMRLFANRLRIGPSSASIAINKPLFDELPVEPANFDTLGNALVTVYQIIIGDKFTQVVSTLWRGTGPLSVLYVVAIVVIGRFILLNLFLSILLSNANVVTNESITSAPSSVYASNRTDRLLKMAEGSLLSAVRGSLDGPIVSDSHKIVAARSTRTLLANVAEDSEMPSSPRSSRGSILIRPQAREIASPKNNDDRPQAESVVEQPREKNIEDRRRDVQDRRRDEVMERFHTVVSVELPDREPTCGQVPVRCYDMNCLGTDSTPSPSVSQKGEESKGTNTVGWLFVEAGGEQSRREMVPDGATGPTLRQLVDGDFEDAPKAPISVAAVDALRPIFKRAASKDRGRSLPRKSEDENYRRGRARQSVELFRRCVRRFAESRGRRAGTAPDYQYVFKIFDSDNSGEISIDELKLGSVALDVRLNERQLAAMVEVVDEDGNGVLSYAEFMHHFGPRAANFHDLLVEGEIDLLQNLHNNGSSLFLTGDVKAQFADGSSWAYMSVFPLEPGKSLGLFSPTNKLRLTCATIIDWAYFEPIVLALVTLSCLALILDHPLADPNGRPRRLARTVDIVLTIVFLIEITMKVIASGLYSLGPRAYLRSSFNCIDVSAIACGFYYDIFLLISRTSSRGLTRMHQFANAARALRGVRALRFFRHFVGLRKLVEAFCEALPNILQIGMTVFFLLYICALLSRQLLSGHLRTCHGQGATMDYADYNLMFSSERLFRRVMKEPHSWDDMSNATKDLFGPDSAVFGYSAHRCSGVFDSNEEWLSAGRPFPCCAAGDDWNVHRTLLPKETCRCFGYSWGKDQPSRFDNIGLAMKALVAVSTGSIADLMYASASIRKRSAVFIPEARPIWFPLWISFQVVAMLVFFNLFVASTVDAFITIRNRHQLQADESLFVTSEQRTWAEYVKRVLRVRPEVRLKRQTRATRSRLWWVTTKRFEYWMSALACFDLVFLSIPYFGQPDVLWRILEIQALVSYSVFSLEAFLKISVMGWGGFLAIRQNKIDLSLVIIGDIGIIVRRFVLDARHFHSHPILDIMEVVPRVLRIIRLARLSRHARTYAGPRRILEAVSHLIPAFTNMLMLLVVLYFVFAIIGVQLFGLVAFHGANNSNMNFRHVGNGFVTLLLFTSNENWDRWMSSGAHRGEGCKNFPRYDRNVCGFHERPGCDTASYASSQACLARPGNTEHDCLIPLNGCGTKLSYVFVLSFMVFVNFVLINLFIGVILESFKTSKAKAEAGDASFFSHRVARDFVKLWSLFDPRGTGVIRRDELRKLLTQLDKPLGFGTSVEEIDRFDAFWRREFGLARKRRRSLLNERVSSLRSMFFEDESQQAGGGASRNQIVWDDEGKVNIDESDDEDRAGYDPTRMPLFSEVGHLILDGMKDSLLDFEHMKDKALLDINASRSSSSTGSLRSSTESLAFVSPYVHRVRRRRRSYRCVSIRDLCLKLRAFARRRWFNRQFFERNDSRWLTRVGIVHTREASRRKGMSTYHIHDILLSLITEMRLKTVASTATDLASSNTESSGYEKKTRENEAFMSTVIAIAQLDAVPFNTRFLVLTNIVHCTPNAIGHRIVRHAVAIRSLDLRNTYLGEIGCDVLCDALEHVSVVHLRALQLANCNVRSPGVRSLAQLLLGAPSLVHFDVSSNRLDSRAITPLANLVASLVDPERILRRFVLFVADNPKLTVDPVDEQPAKSPEPGARAFQAAGTTSIARNLTKLIRCFDPAAQRSHDSTTFDYRDLPRNSSSSSLSSSDDLSHGRFALSLRGCQLGAFFSKDAEVARDSEADIEKGHVAPPLSNSPAEAPLSPQLAILEVLGASALTCLDLCSNALSDRHVEIFCRGLASRQQRMARLDLRNNPAISTAAQGAVIDAGGAISHSGNTDWIIFGEIAMPRSAGAMQRWRRRLRGISSSSSSRAGSSRGASTADITRSTSVVGRVRSLWLRDSAST